MPINTVSVGAAVTPTVIETYISHYLNRKPLHQKPTAHITYHEGLELIRRFLHYASFHTVEELQAFTSQWVPAPHWVHVKEVEISSTLLLQSATHIQAQLGLGGIRQIGGTKWWQWRRDDAPLKAEWIEMRGDHDQRKKSSDAKGKRTMLYVHGGAYFFGSVDEHRYQMQRHARKLKARVFAPRYRLAPQFPFPCGLMDCLAAYLYLLEEGHDPSTILLAGDSAGGGMVVSILVILRDQGVPLPAGAILISPWVDLTHSFPSLGGDGKMDYIPAHGFLHKPSLSWPPPNADDMLTFESKGLSPVGKGTRNQDDGQAKNNEDKDATKETQKEAHDERVHGFTLRPTSEQPKEDSMRVPGDSDIRWIAEDGKFSIGPKSMLSVDLEGTSVDIKDQIQLYAANHLLTHPLVSPVLQPSLGGLPPLLIQVGGGELLRDEQVYLAHKTAAPLAYLPRTSNHQTREHIQAEAVKYRPTNVQLQLWDDLCHVAPTLSFTRPAKYMYRSIAQFGAWALARAQKTSIDILDDDDVSVISTGSSSTSSESDVSPDDIKLNMPNSAQSVGFESVTKKDDKPPHSAVGRAGDPLPPFNNHMIRQQINRHGRIRDMPPVSEIEALNIPSSEIGVPKAGPVNKWMSAQKQWNQKFAKQKIKVQKKRMRDMEKGYEGFDGETPPPTALAGRRVKGMTKEKSKKKSWGMALWSLWGSKHDQITIEREHQADQNPENTTEDKKETAVQDSQSSQPLDGAVDNKSKGKAKRPPKKRNSSFRSGLSPAPSGTRPRSRSRHSTVTDRGQINSSPPASLTNLAPPGILGLAEATSNAPEVRGKASPLPSPRSEISEIPSIVVASEDETLIPVTSTNSTRPIKGPVAFPFSLKVDGADEGKNVNPSMVTLQSISVEEAGAEPTGSSEVRDTEVTNTDDTNDTTEGVVKEAERPAPERFVTAGAGELNGIAPVANETGETDNAQRPGVERFETAQEDLNIIANKSAS